jgi:hypothetical protein
VESDGAGADFGGLEVSDLMRPINEVVAMYKSQSLKKIWKPLRVTASAAIRILMKMKKPCSVCCI